MKLSSATPKHNRSDGLESGANFLPKTHGETFLNPLCLINIKGETAVVCKPGQGFLTEINIAIAIDNQSYLIFEFS